jgi:VWFA-related protein
MPAVGRRVTAVAIFLLFTLSLSAQPTPLTATAGETIEVSIVNVDVFVTDRKGNRVRGLSADDFEIRENGKPQPITNFAEYSSDIEAGELTVDGRAKTTVARNATAAREKRTIVVFIESMTLAPFRSKVIFDSIRQMLRETVRPGDSVAIVSWLQAALVRQDFTDDLESLEHALDVIEEENTGVESNPADEIRRRTEFLQEFQRELVDAGYPIGEAATTAFHALSTAQAELVEIRQKSYALRSYMEAIAGFEGKRIMIMATRRFGQYAGAQYFGGEVPFRYRNELDTRPYRDALIATANANNITVYPIFSRGLGWSYRGDAEDSGRNLYRIDSDGDMRRFSAENYALLNETTSLDEIADETGGMLAWGSKDVAKLMPRITDDLESYYSLGYRASATGRDDARSIRVTMKNKDYVVRSRREYVEKSDDTRMTDTVVANLVRTSKDGRLPIEVEVGEITNSGRRRQVPLKIRIPVDALSRQESGGEFSVYLASGGAFGVISEVDRRTQRYTIDEVKLATVDDAAFTYELIYTIERAAYRLSVGVFDEVSKEYGLAHIELPLEDGQ